MWISVHAQECSIGGHKVGGQSRKASMILSEAPCGQQWENKRVRVSPDFIPYASDSNSTPMEATRLETISVPSGDDILTQMIIQSGAKSCSEVVEFCRSSGIPVSRMLRLDLMRQLSLQSKMDITK
mmetsp:Transcript_4216/g.5549  ORF Transcript_4216/g.5549 Transcript_4216/m.5549 type:complete len:126 (+) Transcript_4216:194-571(+)|eukprot:CAMPEP_0198143924 /NCGR_PEP_ID=MMETSP1443-20131203/11721_1 /TAXON_ID=186043 /ORGANISM="Entomoneis sp., Strain CCMP2396" /LENGTH=125 /DNA_ID=CAMNT_0043807229 /DNA_START=159 /DNA_END=536 /DNA_ORIENTATION=+